MSVKVFEINSVPYGSTAKIMLGIAEVASAKGVTVIISAGYSTHPIKNLPENYVPIGGFFDKSFHLLAARLTGYHGCFSKIATMRLINKMKQKEIGVIHLHNLHGWYINLPMLFHYIKKYRIPVIWTLHDCWAFTGHCPNFDMIGCEKWKTGCCNCPQYREYPMTYVDRCRWMYNKKREWFTGVENMTIVTPSHWLENLVNQSFLGNYPVKVIRNGIDLSIFKPTDSNFRKKYNCEDKYIVLGVAFGWGKRKGLDAFVELASRLTSEYQIVLVGTDGTVDKQLPDNIISIHRTQNQRELAEIYTAADVFVNPTREENYPTVNMESLACGTPVITFDTGGSPEILDISCGKIIPKNDISALCTAIEDMVKDLPKETECVIKAKEFDQRERFEEYMNLYRQKEF